MTLKGKDFVVYRLTDEQNEIILISNSVIYILLLRFFDK